MLSFPVIRPMRVTKGRVTADPMIATAEPNWLCREVIFLQTENPGLGPGFQEGGAFEGKTSSVRMVKVCRPHQITKEVTSWETRQQIV